MSSRNVRSLVFRVHTWLGLHISLFMAFLFLTGTLLVVMPELEVAGHPGAFSLLPAKQRTATMGQIYDSVTSTYPDTGVVVIERRYGTISADRTQLYAPWGEMVSIWTNPATAAVDAATSAGKLKGALKSLHEQLLVPLRPVYLAVSALSFVLLAMIVSGLISYRRFWKGLFRWPSRTAGRRGWLGGVHRMAALWSLPLILITSLTGIYFFLGGLGLGGHAAGGGKTPARETVLPAGFDGALIDRGVAAAQARVPGFDPKVFVPPQKKDDPMSFGGPSPLADSLFGMTQITVDPVTLEVVKVLVPSDNRGMARIKQAVNALHFGTWWDDYSKPIWVALGSLATALAVSGAMVFAARTAQGRAAAEAGAGGLRRFWRGMGLLRWGYALALVAAVGAGLAIYGPYGAKPVRLFPAEAGQRPVQLTTRAPFRADRPATLRLAANTMTDLASAEVQVNDGAPIPVALHGEGKGRSGSFTVQPGPERMVLTLTLTGADGRSEVLHYRLGRTIR